MASLNDAIEQTRANKGKSYVYVLSYPDGCAFYVGIGKNYRVSRHEAYAKEGRRGRKHSIIRKLIAENVGVNYSLFFFLTREEAIEEERRLIALYGRRDLHLGLLENFTDGGDGPEGIERSAETRAKMSAALKGRTYSPEVKAAISVSVKNLWKNPEYKARVSAAMKDAAKNPARLRQISTAHKGNRHSDLSKRKISEGNRKCKRTPEQKRRYAAALKLKWADPIYRAMMLKKQQMAAAKRNQRKATS